MVEWWDLGLHARGSGALFPHFFPWPLGGSRRHRPRALEGIVGQCSLFARCSSGSSVMLITPPDKSNQSVLSHGAYLTSEMLARVVLRLRETQNSGDGVVGEPQLFLPLLRWPARFQAAVVPECVGPQL